MAKVIVQGDNAYHLWSRLQEFAARAGTGDTVGCGKNTNGTEAFFHAQLPLHEANALQLELKETGVGNLQFAIARDAEAAKTAMAQEIQDRTARRTARVYQFANTPEPKPLSPELQAFLENTPNLGLSFAMINPADDSVLKTSVTPDELVQLTIMLQPEPEYSY